VDIARPEAYKCVCRLCTETYICLFNYLFTYGFFSEAHGDLEHRTSKQNGKVNSEYVINWKHSEGSNVA
jgi:hypothetical protein